jgi:hypothetical protein
MEAAGRFARGDEISEIAHDLWVTEGSVRNVTESDIPEGSSY